MTVASYLMHKHESVFNLLTFSKKNSISASFRLKKRDFFVYFTTCRQFFLVLSLITFVTLQCLSSASFQRRYIQKTPYRRHSLVRCKFFHSAGCVSNNNVRWPFNPFVLWILGTWNLHIFTCIWLSLKDLAPGGATVRLNECVLLSWEDPY